MKDDDDDRRIVELLEDISSRLNDIWQLQDAFDDVRGELSGEVNSKPSQLRHEISRDIKALIEGVKHLSGGVGSLQFILFANAVLLALIVWRVW